MNKNSEIRKCFLICYDTATMAQLMKNVYYDPSSPGGFGGKQRLKQAVLENTGVVLQDKEVNDWLAEQDTYTLHRQAPIHFRRNRVIVKGINTQFQADLVDMSDYSKENDGITFMLTCIDVLSKYAWVRVMKNKSGSETTDAFKSILEDGRVPKNLQTDKGKEFFNKGFRSLVKEYNIHHFATGSELKASVIERFNRSLKTKMWRFLTAVNSKRYVDILQDLVRGYNHSYHRSIKMRPVDVAEDNEDLVFITLYAQPPNNGKKIRFKYKVGDTVRISKLRGVFSKGYEKNYTDEFFTVSECIRRDPPVYTLKDYDGEKIDGTFYTQELQKIIIGENKTYKVERILSSKKQGKKNFLLVKWVGWPDKFNTWLLKENLVDIQSP